MKEVNWEFAYISSNDCTLDNTLKMFQYKVPNSLSLFAGVSIDAKNISIFIFGPEQRYYY
jgi:Na+-transporting NADH:ubiquinone oxidoreductase subunit NqrD